MKQHCSRQQKPWNNGSVAFLQGRELGKPLAVGQYNRYVSNMYRSVDVVHYWDPAKTSTNTHHGGIFNFDFSTDGYAKKQKDQKEKELHSVCCFSLFYHRISLNS